MGVGNQVSCEFNLLYRWHATISDRDDKWTQELIKTIFPGKDISKLSIQEFQNGVYGWKTTINPKPEKRDWNMGMLKRHADGTFDDGELIKILTESIEDCAGISTSGN
jgi:linoleate 8R-lipoxygenase / 9,12-octadecadienoate 8-hydroperoxide 8R-isomerase